MIKFPMIFPVEAKSPAGINSNWTAQASDLPPIPCAITHEFMGPGKGYSPEDLFGIALINCLIASYKVYCEKAKISFEMVQAKANVTVNKELSASAFKITAIEVFIDVTGASDVGKAKSLMDIALLNCAVSNSINSSKSFHVNVT